MLIESQFSTVEEHLQLVQELIDMVDNTHKDSEDFHNTLRSLPPQYFKEWVSGTAYVVGDIYVSKNMKYLVIKDVPSTLRNIEPYLALMREYSLPYQGVWANLWAYKEPVITGTLRYPYGSTDIYIAKHDIISEINTLPPNENLDYWRLATEPEEEENK